MIASKDAVFIFIDVQGRLAELMDERERLFGNLERLVRGMRLMEVPVLVTEQIPEKLGSTRPEFAEALVGAKVYTKCAFSCGGAEAFLPDLAELDRRHVILAGIESHVCVYQTASDLLDEGYEVLVVADAVSSRQPYNREIALQRMRDIGAFLVTTEMILMELLGTAEHPKFREVLKLIR